MIITRVEPIPLRIPFRAGNTSDASAWGDSNLPAADSLLVKVTTDQGLIGWGEAFGFRAVASAKLAIDQLIAPLCIGQDARRIEPLMLDVTVPDMPQIRIAIGRSKRISHPKIIMPKSRRGQWRVVR